MRRWFVLPGIVLPVLLLVLMHLPPRTGATGAPPRLSVPGPAARPTNLLINGDFETGDISPWTTFYPAHGGGRAYITASPTHSGTFAARLVTNGNAGTASGVAGGGHCSGGVRIPVQPYTSYTWSGWILVPPGTALASAYLRVAWYALPDCAGGSQLGSSRSSLVTDANGTWIQVEGTAVSPGTAAFAELRLLGVPAMAAGITLYFDDITFAETPPTATPTPTHTPTATPTATATPTPRCPGSPFADACPTDWYYPYVTDLAALGAIGGYPCGGPGEPCYPPGNPPWFRPNNSITRAQVCKVVVLAYALPLNSSTQVFADVPPDNPFFAFINTIANNAISSGYPCGGPGEPCQPPANQPYFRPNNNITRGQVSKIVVLARGWSVLDPAEGSFTDLLPTNAFYRFVETAFAAHILTGYPCGGVNEPCDPQYRPYFRPTSNITRAQAAKMIDRARSQLPPTPTHIPAPTATGTATTVQPAVTATPTLGVPATDTPTPVPPTLTITPTPVLASPTGTSALKILTTFLRLPPAKSPATYRPELRRYPYLTDVVGPYATVNWATDQSGTTGSLAWGRAGVESCTANSIPAIRATVIISTVTAYQWSAPVTLTAGTEYCYRVFLGSHRSTGHRSARPISGRKYPPPPPRPFRSSSSGIGAGPMPTGIILIKLTSWPASPPAERASRSRPATTAIPPAARATMATCIRWDLT